MVQSGGEGETTVAIRVPFASSPLTAAMGSSDGSSIAKWWHGSRPVNNKTELTRRCQREGLRTKRARLPPAPSSRETSITQRARFKTNTKPLTVGFLKSREGIDTFIRDTKFNPLAILQ
jgi:hypothetical protein